MTQPFIGQIQAFGFNFAPRNWAQCNGQLLSIAQNTALFSLLGTMYGGNGVSTFALPDLQSRVPMHAGTLFGEPFAQGEVGGQEAVTLTMGSMPAHNHAFVGSNAAATAAATDDGQLLATVAGGGGQVDFFYGPDATPQPLSPNSISATGGNQPHNNLQPYLAINWCICMFGIYPSRN
jgi:microcystin-dependent protein